MMKHTARIVAAVAGFIVLGACATAGEGAAPVPEPLPSDQRQPQDRPATPRVLVTNLAVPWGIDFLPNGDALITERDTTRVLRITPHGQVSEVATIEAAQPRGEAGLLGLEVSPTFATDRWVYLYYTTATDNRIVRFRYRNGTFTERQVIVSGISAAPIHDGGRLLFGPDGMLYASTGDAGVAERAQDLDSLGGKILRMTPTGQPAPGNPFPDSIVYSYGHRNVEGLTFDADGRLYATEFGGQVDELNRIEPGHNYGWPIVSGFSEGDRFTDPLLTWSPSEASPAGVAVAGGSLWVGALAGERLYRIPLGRNGSVGEPRGLFVNTYGRIRTVARTPRGTLWFATSNRDGRGNPVPSDDRIFVLDLQTG